MLRLRLALEVERHAVDTRVQHAHHDQRRPEIAQLQSTIMYIFSGFGPAYGPRYLPVTVKFGMV